MKNLGKIIFILFITIFSTVLEAKVTASLEPPLVYTGELATYKLTISGGEINKPLIDTLCGENIVSTASSTSIQMVNGSYSKTYELSYQFLPQKDCVIAPVEVEVDGVKERSNPVKVVVRPPSQDKNADFSLSLVPSKKEVFVGEPFEVTLVLKQKLRAQAIDSKFIAPDFKGFWLKGESQPQRVQNDEYIITKAKYKLAAQREGNLTIQPAQLRIATRKNSRNSWGMFMPNIKWRSYFSNKLHIVAKALPNNAKLVGNFSIEAHADKTEIDPNEAVNVTVTVTGDGNLEDIETFKPYINGVNVFDEKVKVNGNKLTQKLAFVSDRSFTIPPFHLDFYDLKTKQVRRISTKAIAVKVRGSVAKKEPLKIKREQNMQSETASSDKSGTADQSSAVGVIWLLIAFIFGVAVGIAIMFIKPLRFEKKEKKFNIKDEKLLLIKLLPYKESDEEVKKIVEILENNLYGGAKQSLDKKVLKEVLKRYKLV